MNKKFLGAVCGVLALVGGVAVAQDPIVTFGFTDLDGDFVYNQNNNTGSFTAVASSLASGGPFATSGDVTRVLPVTGTAQFDTNFIDQADSGNFALNMNISNITNTTAFVANGAFTITDANGDTITGNLTGNWARLGGVFGSFAGTMDNIAFNNTSGDGTFDGSDGGSFSMLFPGGPFYDGAIIVLETGSWFKESFEDTDTQVEASILIPAPGAVLLGVLGLAMVNRLKRKVA